MIISHKHKFIFIKTRKTAGTSLEIALSKFCGEKDIITPISPEDEEIRKKLGHRGPQNHLIPLINYSRKEWQTLFTKRKRAAFSNHAAARFIKDHVDAEVWTTYFKFCFERNPWDKVVSRYFWNYQTEPRPSFADFIKSGDYTRDYHFYVIEGQIVVDKVYRYETLNEALVEISTRLGFPEKLVLPNAKGSFRDRKTHYRDLFGEEEREIVAKAFTKEISAFGYEW